jgi:uncharacterized protein
MKIKLFALILVSVPTLQCLSATVSQHNAIAPVIADRQDSQSPDRVHLAGWIGSRIQANEVNRLAKIDPDRLLEGYRKRPGRQTWDGEHVGKWLHAATLAWVNTGDPVLRQKMDYVVAELTKCQLHDGYLGTYLDKDRWTFWDVWAHKYNLLGLLTYMQYTGDQSPLPVCRRMADLLCNTFGDESGKLDLIVHGRHAGLAPTSVLEPMVLLYRLTGETRYLDFCRYILRAWEQPNGPKVISTLINTGRVDQVGDAKAYEMLSCLNGALEYHRLVNHPKILTACLSAWEDIVDKRLYITGAASYGELFHDDFDLPNVANVGETCVTVTWLQFNAQLLRLTGEARFAEQLERVTLNQLFGAQRCDGSGWGYSVQMEGRKPYSSTLDGHCCLSSGPRGIALIPTFAVTTDAAGVVINLYDSGKADLTLRDGTPVQVGINTRYPADGEIHISLSPAAKKEFTVKLRIPAWCVRANLKVNDESINPSRGEDGYVAVRRSWEAGDRIELELKLERRIVVGDHTNLGKLAVLYGPLVLAADEALLTPPPSSSRRNRSAPPSLIAIAAAGKDLAALQLKPEAAPAAFSNWSGAQVFSMNAVFRRPSDLPGECLPASIKLVPFADAGNNGTRYKVWLPLADTPYSANLLLEGTESRSRPGNLGGSIIDDDLNSAVCTFGKKSAAEDWYAVSLPAPVKMSRVVFVHGRTFHDGGWFDTSADKPRVEVKSSADGPWESVGELADYPSATATDSARLAGGECFNCRFSTPIKVVAVRVTGKPAGGDNPRQPFSSCAELQAFDKP